MNLVESMDLITRDLAHQVAEYTASGVYAYLQLEIEELRKKGEDLTKYEIVFITNDHFTQTKDRFRIEKTVRLHKLGTLL